MKIDIEKLLLTDLTEVKLVNSKGQEYVPIVHGHWIGVSQTKFEKLFFSQRAFKCSVCGNYLDFDGVNVGRGSANYCPNCGAKMDEEKEDE